MGEYTIPTVLIGGSLVRQFRDKNTNQVKKYKNNLITILLLALVCAGLFWHVQNWQNSGRYADMNSYIGTSRAALTVIYDIGITLLFAGALGLLFSKIIDGITKR